MIFAIPFLQCIDPPLYSVSRPAYMSLPSPNMPTAEDEDEPEANTEVRDKL